MKRIVFVSSPYTRFRPGLEEAFLLACRETARLIAAGIPAYSPIVHSHPVAAHGGLDQLDWHMWMRISEPMIAAAGALVVICADGWRESVGVQAEIAAFRQRRRMIFHLEPGRPIPGDLLEMGVRVP